MTIVEVLPLYAEYRPVFTISLEGQDRRVRLYWNNRKSNWQIDMYQDDSTPIVLGVALVANYPMLANYSLRKYGLTGSLVLVPKGDTNPHNLNESYENLSSNYILAYIYENEDNG